MIQFLCRQRDRHKHEQPKQWVPPDFLKEQFHAGEWLVWRKPTQPLNRTKVPWLQPASFMNSHLSWAVLTVLPIQWRVIKSDYELGHRHLVDRGRSVHYAGTSSVHRLVEGLERSRQPRVFSRGKCGGSFR